VYAVVRTFGRRCPLVSVGFDCVAQPTTKQAKVPASARLRHLGIGVDAFNTSPHSRAQAVSKGIS
jgi:hypothetical protein